MRKYEIHTEADSRSKARRSRDWTIQAGSEDDARYEARMRHIAVVGWNSSIAVISIKETR